MAAENPSIAEVLFHQTFNRPRQPRSDEYKAGVLAALERRATQKRVICPYRIGTAQADAFSAGCREGHDVWESHNNGR